MAGRGRVAVDRWSLTVDPVGGSRSRKGPEPMELVVPVTVVEAENAELWRRLGATSTNSSAGAEESIRRWPNDRTNPAAATPKTSEPANRDRLDSHTQTRPHFATGNAMLPNSSHDRRKTETPTIGDHPTRSTRTRKKPADPGICRFSGPCPNRRDDRIRTCDPLTPSAARARPLPPETENLHVAPAP